MLHCITIRLIHVDQLEHPLPMIMVSNVNLGSFGVTKGSKNLYNYHSQLTDYSSMLMIHVTFMDIILTPFTYLCY